MAEMWVLDPVGWDELQTIVAKTGATLITKPPAGIGDWLGDFADQIGDHSVDEAPIWTSAHRTEAGWFWGDGTAIAQSFWRESDVNGDGDPTNDSEFASLVGDKLVEGPGNTAVIYSNTGTQYRDHMLGGLENVTLRLLGDDDYYHGYANGGTLDLGAGDDQAVLDDYGPLASTVIDGDGSDYIEASKAVIKASLDGDQDYFYTGARVTYAAGTTGILILDDDSHFGHVISTEFGSDIIDSAHVVGTNYDDVMAGIDRLSGGKGNDIITPQFFAEGGDGDDYLVADSFERVELRGENGNDTFVFFTDGKAGGGAGIDTFAFGALAKATINDLSYGETIDISDLLEVGRDVAWSGGFLKQTITGGYTHLWIDQDGGADSWSEIANIKGAFDLSGFLAF